MGTWLSNISLKYKFWAVNAVAFVTTLLLVLYAVQLEQQSRSTRSKAPWPGSRIHTGAHRRAVRS